MKRKLAGSFVAGKILSIAEKAKEQLQICFQYGPYLMSKQDYRFFSGRLVVGERVTIEFEIITSQKVWWHGEKIDMPLMRVRRITKGVRMKRLLRLAGAQ